ncbi:D-alanyl-D-alanine carboxypeptidase family protein [Butyrivibrio sp. YAB3001]|uniref:D-alanyl-D-alanine carboxypeptidase family protein n=1 Tax=Butyrivibrio sp. YAB3001 TaxID=1520812 RepID=UPI0008F66C87|nr:D-alanyl-D-alanine carboxypeptidase family protein [Butyrivibrio sp. YAB3001]SFC88402.1 D-alanyl-D-alanine carboxypeptidase (penicillin-binding protein 5/6) [Butyrivibrio sp. YAB3001]
MFILVMSQLYLPVHATENIDYEAEALERKELPIQSNEIASWPEGPAIGAEAAIVMEAKTGTILYSKNIHEELYPASTTKIMTCLLAVENASLSDRITFSHDAVFSVPRDGSSIGMDVGESISLEQALYGIMVGSANEVANAVAEHVSGSIDDYVKLMNTRAKELGCTNTHFNNTNGLQDSNHYTSAYDLALIAREFFNNDFLCKVGNTPRYHFEPTDTQPDDFYLNNKHKLITGEVKYDGIVGGKTGYTGLARETLVTCAEKNGMKLICVVLKEESPAQFTDTVTLFDYGFNNFKSVNVSDNDSRYMPDDSLFFESEHDVFGKSGTILTLDSSSNIIIPKISSITETAYSVSYELTESEKSLHNSIAKISYTFSGVPVGTALINYSSSDGQKESTSATKSNTIYINILVLFIIAAVLLIIVSIISSMNSRSVPGKRYFSRSDKIRYNRRKREFKKNKHNF